MSSVRLRRLQADFEKLADFTRRHPRLRLVQTEGNPPESYQLEYSISSLRQIDGKLVMLKSHIVEILLPRNYPRLPPQCRMLTPIFHPNIAPHAICIGDHWAAGEPLWSMAARIGEMIAYQSYNTKSPLNGEAARWVDENIDRLPLDPISMTVDEAESPAAAVRVPTAKLPMAKPVVTKPATTQPATTQPATTQPATTQPPPAAGASIQIQCPSCQTRYRVAVASTAKKARCKKCQSGIEIPSQSSDP